MMTAMQDLTKSKASGSSGIKSRLRQAIETGVYAESDKLPPERDLATVFSAARSTVRKALDELEAEGFVERRVGSGTYVSYNGPVRGETGQIVDLLSPMQLIDARLSVEPNMCRLAAVHATQRDLERVEAVLEELETCDRDRDRFSEFDSQFHLAIARCSRNPLIIHIYEQINEVRRYALWNAVKEKVLSVEQIKAYNVQHRAIFQALAWRKSTEAAEFVRAHLRKARQDLVGVEEIEQG